MIAKLKSIGWRVMYIFGMFPVRMIRLLIHLLIPFKLFRRTEQYRIIEGPFDWFAGIPLYLIDILGVPEIYEIFFELFKWRIRDLDPSEIRLLNKYFGNSISDRMIRLDERSHLGPRQYHFAYVSFHTINSYGPMGASILIHELVHVWQYNRLGSIYAYKAIRAQHSTEAYNYGGLEALLAAKDSGKKLLDFNFEQQADIIMDAFRIKQMELTKIDASLISLYAYFVEQISKESNYNEHQRNQQ